MNKYLVLAKGKQIAKVNLLMDMIAAFSVYSCFLPLLLLDVFIWQFQTLYFRIKEIPLIERRRYVIIDRYQLAKLTIFQKINCMYCEYANGVVAYAKAVVNQMELYSCAIKHSHHPLGQDHQKDFFEREEFE